MAFACAEYFAADEIAIWENLFYSGLSACVPIDENSDVSKPLNGSPPVPYVFTERLTLDQIETKMNFLLTKDDNILIYYYLLFFFIF